MIPWIAWIPWIPWILGGLYIILYWGNSDPPIRDVLSPLITLTFAAEVLMSYPLSKISCLVIMGLLVDSVADYLMDSNNLELPIVMFSYGHMIKQISFSYAFSYPIYTSAHIITFILVGLLSLVIYNRITKRPSPLLHITFIGSYVVIIAITFFHVCFAERSFSVEFLLFVISDIIIAVELILGKLNPRQLRILLVPILYWGAEYLTASYLMKSYEII